MTDNITQARDVKMYADIYDAAAKHGYGRQFDAPRIHSTDTIYEDIEVELISKWLRDHKQLHISIGPNWSALISFLDQFQDYEWDGEKIKMYSHIHLTNDEGDEIFYSSYEEALRGSVIKCFDILKQRNEKNKADLLQGDKNPTGK